MLLYACRPAKAKSGRREREVTEEETAALLRRTIIQLARRFNASATDENLTPSQASTLGLVTARGPLPVSEVARIDSLNPTMVSRIVGVLESEGLLERRKDTEDQRSYIVSATPRGVALHERIRAQRLSGILSAMRTLEPSQIEAVRGALGAMEALADAMP